MIKFKISKYIELCKKIIKKHGDLTVGLQELWLKTREVDTELTPCCMFSDDVIFETRGYSYIKYYGYKICVPRWAKYILISSSGTVWVSDDNKPYLEKDARGGLYWNSKGRMEAVCETRSLGIDYTNSLFEISDLEYSVKVEKWSSNENDY